MLNRYFGYIRVSTPKQGVRGSSLQEQKSAIEAYASRQGLSLTAWFEERETAAKQGRHVFARMLKELDRGTARGVIIHKIDRSARNLKDWAYLGELIDRGVDVRFAHDNLDLTSRGGRLSADIQAVVAADFIRNLRDEVKKGFYGRLKQGVYPLPAPVGYRDMGAGRPKEPDPVQAPLVRETFELYASEKYNFLELQQEMHRRGLRNRHGGTVSLAGFGTILNNTFYIGLIRIQKTNEMFQGKHAPLIPKALFDRVQAILRGRRTGQPWRHEFLFRRAIRCAHCGNLLTGERQKSRYVYYRCHKGGCPGASVSESKIEAALRHLFGLLRFNDREVREFREMIEALRVDGTDETTTRKATLQIQIGKCDERLARLTDAVIDGLLDKESFDSRKAGLLKERRQLQDHWEQAQTMPSLAERLSQNFELANTAYLSYENGIPPEKRDLAVSLTSNFSAHGKYPAITLRSPFQELVNSRLLEHGGPRRDTVRTSAVQMFEILRNADQAAFEASLIFREPANDNESGLSNAA